MKKTIVEIDRKQGIGYMVTVDFSPNLVERLFRLKPHRRKFFSEHTHLWYDADTFEEISYVNNNSIRTFLTVLDEPPAKLDKNDYEIRIKSLISRFNSTK